MQKPDLYRFLDYRRYLEEMRDYLKSRSEFTARDFAKKVGFGSSSYFGMVIKGERNLSDKTLSALSTVFNHNESESRFFKNLVEFNQAKKIAEKEVLFQELMKFSKFREMHEMSSDEYEFFGNWYMSAIWEAITSDWADLSDEVKAWSLGIRVDQLRDAIERLVRLGLIENEDGKWKHRVASLKTPLETSSLAIAKYHEGMLEQAKKSIRETPSAERFFSGLTITLEDKSYQELQQRLVKLLQEFDTAYSEDKHREMSKSKIYQLSLSLFPLIHLD